MKMDFKERLNKLTIRKEGARQDLIDAEKKWAKMSRADQLKAYKATGSFVEPEGTKIGDIGGSTADALIGFIMNKKEGNIKDELEDERKRKMTKEAMTTSPNGKFKIGDVVTTKTGVSGKIINISVDLIRIKSFDDGKIIEYDEDDLIKGYKKEASPVSLDKIWNTAVSKVGGMKNTEDNFYKIGQQFMNDAKAAGKTEQEVRAYLAGHHKDVAKFFESYTPEDDKDDRAYIKFHKYYDELDKNQKKEIDNDYAKANPKKESYKEKLDKMTDEEGGPGSGQKGHTTAEEPYVSVKKRGPAKEEPEKEPKKISLSDFKAISQKNDEDSNALKQHDKEKKPIEADYHDAVDRLKKKFPSFKNNSQFSTFYGRPFSKEDTEFLDKNKEAPEVKKYLDAHAQLSKMYQRRSILLDKASKSYDEYKKAKRDYIAKNKESLTSLKSKFGSPYNYFYRLDKDCHPGKKGDIIEVDESGESSYWKNLRTGAVGSPFIEYPPQYSTRVDKP